MLHVGVDRECIAAVCDEVEPEHAFEALGSEDVADHDVVAALGVVVVVALATDEHVMTAVGVVLELVVLVADQQVELRTSFHPVVSSAGE